MARRRWLPANVTEYTDRHGKRRYRFRRKGCAVHHFANLPGTEEFMAEYRAALTTSVEAAPRHAPFSYDELIASFYRSTKWQEMRPSSQATYRGIIERFRAKNGTKDARQVDTPTIDKKLASMSETPAAANNLRKCLSRLHRHAIKLGWRKDNPVSATDPYKAGKGFHTWTDAEIEQYRRRWALGTKERLAMELLLGTALRRSDMVTLGRQHRDGSELILRHEKNSSDTIIPVMPDLEAALDAMPPTTLTYLVTEYGKPFTGNGFGNWFRERCNLAELPHCTAHGLRKAMSRRLAESGATSLEGRAITGHKTDREFAHYAEKADKRRLARSGAAKMVANQMATPAGEPKKS